MWAATRSPSATSARRSKRQSGNAVVHSSAIARVPGVAWHGLAADSENGSFAHHPVEGGEVAIVPRRDEGADEVLVGLGRAGHLSPPWSAVQLTAGCGRRAKSSRTFGSAGASCECGRTAAERCRPCETRLGRRRGGAGRIARALPTVPVRS